MMSERFIAETLEASMSNPEDAVEVTLMTDAASVGITDPLYGSNKRVKLTEDFLRANSHTFKGMPITLEINESNGKDGTKQFKLSPHSKTIIGTIKDAYFDEATKKAVTVGTLYKHYFPRTLKQLDEIYKAGKAQVSWELIPGELKALPDEGDNVFEPLSGRFVGQAIINTGADLGNAITLLAAVAEEESASLKRVEPVTAPVGSFEWIGDKVINFLTSSADPDNYSEKEIIGTFSDKVIYSDGGKLYQVPITINGNNIKFSDTIEVEPIYQPLGASAAGSTEETPEAPPSTKEAGNSNMAEIDERELETLKASKAQAETRADELETENATLKEEVETLQASVADFEEFKSSVEADKATQAQNTLAASRVAEVEKIIPYEDDEQKAEDLEAFKTMEDKSFEIVKRTLAAAAEARGGVSQEAGISNPFTSREDGDGSAAKILNDPAYQQLKASYAAPKEA